MSALGSWRRRRLLRDPLWLWLIVAAAAGAIAGDALSRVQVNEEAAVVLFGRAWRTDVAKARSVLASVFGLQITALTIVLTLNASAIQSAANQYSPRLVPFYLRDAPLRRAIPVFVLAGAYVLAALRALGLLPEDVLRPRPVISVAFTLVVVAFIVLAIEIARTVRFLRVERVLGLVRDATKAAATRLQARLACVRARPRHGAALELPPDACALLAPATGYVVDVDLERLARIARRAGARVRICRAIGDYVDANEIVGWVATDGPPANGSVLAELGRALVVAPNRLLDNDPMYGVRILADVASRAIASSTNDPYTARQTLQHLRTVLRHLASMPLGDWTIVDDDGRVRVSVLASDLSEFLSVAVDAPLRLGASDSEVLDSVLELALEVGLLARDPASQQAIAALIARVLDDAAQYGRLDAGRLAHLKAEADLVRASLERDGPHAERHVRATWALTRAAEEGTGVVLVPEPG